MRLSPQLEDEHETLNQSRKTENSLLHQEDRYKTLTSAGKKGFEILNSSSKTRIRPSPKQKDGYEKSFKFEI
jgi:hypothetical protein